MYTPTLLCVLDGFGLNPNPVGNAVALASKPTFDRLWQKVPSTTLITFGERVGLPDGQMGNSEVGHLNIGAGRVVEQWLLRIGRALGRGSLKDDPTYGSFLTSTGSSASLHLFGLFSDGGVHSHVSHLHALIERLLADSKARLVVHLITDGRDTGPQSALALVQEFEERYAAQKRVRIGSIVGRFFAMDRDKRWERTTTAYKLFVEGIGTASASASEWLMNSYEQGTTDEFIEPAVINRLPILPTDGIVFWNFREDRMRQIVKVLATTMGDEVKRAVAPPPPNQVLCFTEYDHSHHLPFLFAPLTINNHLGEVISKRGVPQLRVAETEKYPHVTYFLNGSIEEPYPGETREMVPSPRDVKTYDLKPEMSAAGVTDIVCRTLRARTHALIVVNIANCDMVGHTGVLAAAIKAVETADSCLGKMLDALSEVHGKAVIIADHGNAEQMINYEDGTPHTAHTKYPVPMLVVGDPSIKSLRADGALCDVAPSILDLMGIPAPSEMTGVSLLQR